MSNATNTWNRDNETGCYASKNGARFTIHAPDSDAGEVLYALCDTRDWSESTHRKVSAAMAAADRKVRSEA